MASTRVVGFGWNACGQLGPTNYLNSISKPTVLEFPEKKDHGKIRCVSTGHFSTLFCTTKGLVMGMGSDQFGVLGGLASDSDIKNDVIEDGKIKPMAPYHVIYPRVLKCFNHIRVVKVACSAEHAAAITIQGQLLTWGKNDSGQLGHYPTLRF